MNRMFKYLKISIEIFFVVLFILFEEIIWERIAKPIGNFFVSLRVLDKTKEKILKNTPYMILLIFIIPLVLAELMGIYSGVLFISGSLLTAIFLYILKIPVAAITFWIFSFSKEILLTIDWFKTIYDLLIRFITFVKNTEIYKRVKNKVSIVKESLKKKLKKFNPKNVEFKEHIKNIYKNVRKTFENNDKINEKEGEK